ncbi:RDD family protein [Halovenus salina]|uniref:RDD family protein n=1 Tax=Halovenus salina TaxID=1510225 RepID=UPI002260AAE2|nr:RDD family protein [Halovenus salina]
MVKPAPLHTRTPAFLCDQAIVSVLGVVPTVAAGVPVAEVVSPGPTRRGVFVLLMGVAFIYHFILEWQTGTTVGKRLFGLGVRRDDGHEIGVVASFVRNALRLVDGLGYWGVAVAIILLRGDGKRLGDMVGRTLVVSVD